MLWADIQRIYLVVRSKLIASKSGHDKTEFTFLRLVSLTDNVVQVLCEYKNKTNKQDKYTSAIFVLLILSLSLVIPQ